MKNDLIEKAKCRNCSMELIGTPYYMGGGAYFPDTMKRVPVNFYGGYVCSMNCDRQVCLNMSSNMPGAGHTTTLNSLEANSVRDNWRES